jgi:SnoaL-like domain
VAGDKFQQLCEIRYRYADAVDRMDWEQYRSLFTEDVMVAATSSLAAPAVDYESLSADEWVERVATMIPGLAATQHAMFNPRAEIDGDRAVLTTYMRADHFLNFEDDNAWYAIGGCYRDHMVHADGVWKIERMRLDLFWTRGNRDILTRARTDVAAGRRATRIV